MIDDGGRGEPEVSRAPRNPTWQRDELILALDLYFKHPPQHISKKHAEVVALSSVLNQLPIHGVRPDAERFRNPNGVYMKLCNFLRLDPSYTGSGLRRGGAEEAHIWTEFASDRQRLEQTAAAIRRRVSGASRAEDVEDPVDEEDEFPEGKVLFRAHRSRERNRTLIARAKAVALRRHHALRCEACDFEFEATYGKLGAGYIECHHVIPISKLSPGETTKLTDVALLCSNCHRMVHRRRPWLTMSQLTALVHGVAE
jgi:5-methylcytosine-specific restriction enzyme A